MLNPLSPLGPRRRRTDRGVEINVISLIDILFVLLIFFMATASFSTETAVEVARPSSGAAVATSGEALAVAITRAGEVALVGHGVIGGDLVGALRGALAEAGTRRALIVADRAAATGRTLAVMDACRAAGADDVRVAASRTGSP